MANKQKSGGGSRKIGNHREHCTKYKQQGKRELSKIKNYKKHNIAKDIDDMDKKIMLDEFIAMQKTRK